MRNFMQTVTAKIIFIFLLVFVLFIPKFMIQGLVSERQDRKSEVASEVSEKWGKTQFFKGPFIEVPVSVRKAKEVFNNTKKSPDIVYYWETEKRSFTPDELDLDIKLEPEVRHRGIFDVLLYSANISGNIKFNKFTPTDQSDTVKYQWNKAWLKFYIADLHGLRGEPVLTRIVDKEKLEEKFQVNIGEQVTLSTPFLKNNDEDIDLKFTLNLQGYESFYLDPFAKKNNIKMTSSWNTPSFTGRYLPTSHTINKDGFTANWEVYKYENSNPYKNIVRFDYQNKLQTEHTDLFGTKLIFPVDFYQQNERAVKYAIMFIVLTFLAFFLIEILQKLRLHPIQYLLIGGAMLLFYAVLLSLSEHLSFTTSYICAAAATISLISLYCVSVFRQKKIVTLIICALLIGVYAYLFVLLKLQDYALIAGTGLLFVVFAVVMFVTRNIDWYNFNKRRT